MTDTLFTLDPDPLRLGEPVPVQALAALSASAPVLRIVVFGTPGPQGSKSFKGLTNKGKAILRESSKKVQPWRDAVMDAAAKLVRCCDDPSCGELRTGYPIDEPLVGRVVFTLKKPASAPKRKTTYPDRYPDVSKLLRSTEDALTQAGVWKDDARLVNFTRLAKVFPGEDPEALPVPGAVIEIWRLIQRDLSGAQ